MGVWLCVIALVFASTLCVHVVTNCHPTDRTTMAVGECFFLVFGALTAQSKFKCVTAFSTLVILNQLFIKKYQAHKYRTQRYQFLSNVS